MSALETNDQQLLPKSRFDEFIRVLVEDGYEVLGPRIDEHAIVYGPVRSALELPIGWTDRQAPGSYRLEKRDDDAYFGFAVGPHSWKKYLFPPALSLWQAQRTDNGFEISAREHDPPKRAFLGIRSCELHAIAIQDRVFINRDDRVTDPYYAEARRRLFLVAVECTQAGGTCFCTSMGTGPEVHPERIPLTTKSASAQDSDHPGASARMPLSMAAPTPEVSDNSRPYPVCDLILTELDDAFVIRAASLAGQQVVDRLDLASALPQQVENGQRRVSAAAEAMGRTLDVTDVRSLLHRNQEHPRWDDVANRCLACANCTLVCPTCFCSCTEDVTDFSRDTAERVRRWDSCFNPEFASVHGGNFRPSIRGRYRQWLTHKFASWIDQFDVSGCVGCGRCITWCPVGIDVTEEIAALRATDRKKGENPP